MKLYVMVGNIGSGKTTLVKRFLASNPEVVVVSRDALRYMVGAGKYVYDKKLEPVIFDSALCLIDEFMYRGVDILVDETNVCESYRKDYLNLAKAHHYEPIAIEMPQLDKKISVDRRMQDPHGQPDRVLWEGVWDKFDAIYEEPTIEEGFYKVYQPKGGRNR